MMSSIMRFACRAGQGRQVEQIERQGGCNGACRRPAICRGAGTALVQCTAAAPRTWSELEGWPARVTRQGSVLWSIWMVAPAAGKGGVGCGAAAGTREHSAHCGNQHRPRCFPFGAAPAGLLSPTQGAHAPVTRCSCLMVSPWRPMMRPTMPLGQLITCVLPMPCCRAQAGEARPANLKQGVDRNGPPAFFCTPRPPAGGAAHEVAPLRTRAG